MDFKIEKDALVHCFTKEKFVTVPDNIKVIANYAFNGCGNLTTIKLPSNLEEIGDYAFCGCENLTSIDIPKTAKTIGKFAFRDCKSLQTVNLSDSLLDLGDNCFHNCTSLTEIKIPANIKAICPGTFIKCKNLIKVELPDGLKRISSNAFLKCELLKQINLPDSIIKIDKFAFRFCENLKEIKLPKSIEAIKREAFAGCINIEKFTVDPANENFREIDGVIYTKDLDDVILYPVGKKDKKFVVPNTVTHIKRNMLSECVNLEEIVVSEGVASIGEFAFFECKNLRKINFPTTLYSVKLTAFDKCKNLSEVYVSTLNEYVGNNIFFTHCLVPGSFSTFNLNVKMICKDFDVFEHRKSKYRTAYACGYIYALQNGYEYTDKDKESFKKYIKTQRKKLFRFIEYYKGVLFYMLDNKLLEGDDIGNLLKLDCIKEDVELKNSVLSYSNAEIKPKDEFAEFEKQIKIAEEFSKTRKLPVAEAKKQWTYVKNEDNGLKLNKYKGDDTDVVIPRIIGKTKVTELNNYLFGEGNKVRSVDIPDTINIISAYSFAEMEYLESVNLPEGLNKIEKSAFNNCIKLTNIQFPDSLTVIDDAAFWFCESLKGKLDLTNVTRIGKRAFECCSKITSLSFSKNLKKIDDEAFFGCSNLSGDIIFDNYELHISERAFMKCGFKTIIFGDGVTYITYGAFAYCNNLVKVEINENIYGVNNRAFENCENLREVIIKCDLTKVQKNAFYRCEAVEKVVIKKEYADNLSKLYKIFGDNIQIEYLD